MHFRWPLAIEIYRPDGGVDDRLLHDPHALLLADGGGVEEEVVRRLGDLQSEELLPVFVDVGRRPAPVAVADVVKVLETALSEREDKCYLSFESFRPCKLG